MDSGILFKGFRDTVGFLLRHLIFSSIEIKGLENLPPSGVPVLLVGNHQNGLMDPLSVICSLKDRKVHVFTRADIFGKGKLISRLAQNMGMIPAYRLDREGLDMVALNNEVMHDAGELLINGGTLLIYPESTHSERCHMGEFSSAYLRMAFGAAHNHNFSQEILIIPVGVHYSSYYGIRNRALLSFGKPEPLSEWYHLYEEKPRTACRELNHIVRNLVQDLVLEIADENYNLREELCISHTGKGVFTGIPGNIRTSLSGMLSEDQTVMRNLENLDTESQDRIMSSLDQYNSILDKYNVYDKDVSQSRGLIQLFFHSAILFLLLPLGIVSLWPGIVAWIISKRLADKSGSACFANLFLISVGALLIMPVLSIATTVVTGLAAGWRVPLVWLCLLPLLSLFTWYYWNDVKSLLSAIRYLGVDENIRQELFTQRQILLSLRLKLTQADKNNKRIS